MKSMTPSTYIIAEAGVNHNGSLALAKQLVDVAKAAGADAVKFQTFKAEALVSQSAPKADYQKKSTAKDESQLAMLKALELGEEEQVELQQYCQQAKIEFLSTPFDLQSVDFLNHTCHLSKFKVASGEINNLPLLVKIAQAGKPIILSTGMSTLGDIELALSVLVYGYLNPEGTLYPSLTQCADVYYTAQGQQIARDNITLLHCTTEYPAPVHEVNLRAMHTMQKTFGLNVGYSDHTLGDAVALAAVACGATMIEKHFTLDPNMPGPDHQASLSPAGLTAMIAGIRQVELALGHGKKIPSSSELKNRAIARKSLVAKRAIKQGETLTQDNVCTKRPGNGLSPLCFNSINGQPAERDYAVDELI